MQTIHANDSSICASFSFFHSCQSRSIGLVGSCVIDQRLIRTQHLNTLNSFKYSFQMCHDGGVVNLQCQCCHNLSTLFLSDKGTDFSVFMPQEHPHLIKIKHFRKSCSSLLSLLADIGKTTKTTSTTYNYASLGTTRYARHKPAERETTKYNKEDSLHCLYPAKVSWL